MLYWRLRRLLLEDRVESQILDVRPGFTHGQVVAMLRRWFTEDKEAVDVIVCFYFISSISLTMAGITV